MELFGFVRRKPVAVVANETRAGITNRVLFAIAVIAAIMSSFGTSAALADIDIDNQWISGISCSDFSDQDVQAKCTDKLASIDRPDWAEDFDIYWESMDADGGIYVVGAFNTPSRGVSTTGVATIAASSLFVGGFAATFLSRRRAHAVSSTSDD